MMLQKCPARIGFQALSLISLKICFATGMITSH